MVMFYTDNIILLIFNQKTSYEMRVSDWRSYMFYSDLQQRQVRGARADRESARCEFANLGGLRRRRRLRAAFCIADAAGRAVGGDDARSGLARRDRRRADRKSTHLNSSH